MCVEMQFRIELYPMVVVAVVMISATTMMMMIIMIHHCHYISEPYYFKCVSLCFICITAHTQTHRQLSA